MAKFRYYLVTEDGEVLSTNHAATAKAARNDGRTLVLDTEANTSGFDGEVQNIKRADSKDWVDDEGNPL